MQSLVLLYPYELVYDSVIEVSLSFHSLIMSTNSYSNHAGQLNGTSHEQTLISLFDETSQATALVLPELDNATLSFQQLAHLVHEAVKQLETSGIKRGDVVSLFLPNSLAFIVFFLAITHIGAIAAPLNPGFKPTEVVENLHSAVSALCLVPTSKFQSKDYQTDVPFAECSANVSMVSLSLIPNARPSADQNGSSKQNDTRPSDPALLLYTSKCPVAA